MTDTPVPLAPVASTARGPVPPHGSAVTYRRCRRASAVLTAVLLFLIGPAVLGAAPQAAAGELNGEMRFTRLDRYYDVSDRNGTFTAQVRWEAGGLPVAWSFRLSPALQAIATGPMTCDAGSMELPGYHDHHVDIPPDYYWHSTVGGHFFNQPYTLFGSCAFPVNAGGNPGRAVVRFRFAYDMYSTE